MKLRPLLTTLLAFALAACGSLSITGTPETATSLNGFRASHGLSQLRTDGTLIALASEHSADMARRESLDHDGFMTIQQWVNSSGHRRNMLIPGLTRYGLASAVSPSGRTYWTLLVGE
jgi:uncharacterized protein YkwD